jgi:hypothetical protein
MPSAAWLGPSTSACLLESGERLQSVMHAGLQYSGRVEVL